MKNLYHTLGLNEGASQEEIQEAYDRLKKELNPTKNGNQDFFVEEFEKLQQAYQALRNSTILSANSSQEVVTNFEFNNASNGRNDITKSKSIRLVRFNFLKNKKVIFIAFGMLFFSLIIMFLISNNYTYEFSEITKINGIAYTKKDMLPLNGIVKDDGEYINGYPEGEHKNVDKKGNILAIGFFSKGKKNGLWKEWYPLKDGKWHFWFEKGILKKECNYNNGLLVGEFSTWYSNGQLEKKGMYVKDYEKGNWNYYDINGKKLASYNFDNPILANENLDVSRYRNGDLIPEVKDTDKWNKLKTGAWCYYNNDPKYGKLYGKLYNWYAVNDPRGLAPEGYHIPSVYEYKIIFGKIYNGDLNGYSSSNLFIQYYFNNFSYNQLKFPSLCGGIRQYDWEDNFIGIEKIGHWWCATNLNYYEAIQIYTFKDSYDVIISTQVKNHGMSVRCIKN